MIKQYLLFSFVLLLTFNSFAQNDGEWRLKNEKENITIYTREVQGSHLKELKMTSTTRTSLSAFVAVLDEIETSPEWLNGSFTVTQLDVSHSEIPYNRTVINFPFPVSDRDLIGYATVAQDPATKVVTVSSTAVPDAYPRQKGYVRIPFMNSQWILTPLDNGKVRIDYFLRSDPGGSIPAWVTNMLLDVGPFKIFKGILAQLPKEQYRNAKIPGIVEPAHYTSVN